MTNIEELMKCPECLCEGHFEIIIRHKQIEASCENCDFLVTDRVPYPKHRVDPSGYQYDYRIGDIRPMWPNENDNQTCSQEEWNEKHK